MSTPKKPFFSIIIPTLNEEKYLPTLLGDLATQNYTDFEVIVVDGESTDSTLSFARPFKKQIALHTYISKKKNAGAQRNLGGQKAMGKWVIFMDADNRLPTYFLEGIKYQLAKQKKTDVFTSLLEVAEPEAKFKAIEQALNFALIVIRLLDKPGAYGALIGCKRSVLDTVQFDESLTFSEDGQFVNSCHQAGFHFSLFREPRYTYSMRRLKAEGTLKTLKISIPLLIRYTLGDDMHGVKSYVMLGGKYYDQVFTREKSILSTIQNYIQTASKKQLLKAQSILTSLKKIEF